MQRKKQWKIKNLHIKLKLKLNKMQLMISKKMLMIYMQNHNLINQYGKMH